MLNKHDKWLVVLSGRSGAGKSVVLDQLADLHFYCVDNLLSELIVPLLERTLRSGHNLYNRVAIAVDARNLGHDSSQLVKLFAECHGDESLRTDIVYLDADNDTLIARFKETRRLHPLSQDGIDLPSALDRETRLIEPIRENATLHIDTSKENVITLRERIMECFGSESGDNLSLSFCSFGFKDSMPRDADMVFDVRCLPNPHWHRELRTMSGLDKEVEQFLDDSEQAQDMLMDVHNYLKKWIPRFRRNHCHYLKVAVGCTGGRHRSVYFCQRLCDMFKDDYPGVRAIHTNLSLKR